MCRNILNFLFTFHGQPNGVKRHRSMKPSSRDQLGLASPLNYAAIQSGKTKTPLRRRRSGQGLDPSHTAFGEGRGENFFLDILFHRMSVRVKKRLRGVLYTGLMSVRNWLLAGELSKSKPQ